MYPVLKSQHLAHHATGCAACGQLSPGQCPLAVSSSTARFGPDRNDAFTELPCLAECSPMVGLVSASLGWKSFLPSFLPSVLPSFVFLFSAVSKAIVLKGLALERIVQLPVRTVLTLVPVCPHPFLSRLSCAAVRKDVCVLERGGGERKGERGGEREKARVIWESERRRERRDSEMEGSGLYQAERGGGVPQRCMYIHVK